jgi:hypothetical protein
VAALTAVQRSLRNARARNLAHRAAKKRGLCMDYCRCVWAGLGSGHLQECMPKRHGACSTVLCFLSSKVQPDVLGSPLPSPAVHSTLHPFTCWW